MCGGGDANLLAYEKGDTIRCTESAGKSPRIGKVDEQHVLWGLAVIWEDGTRQWLSYDR